MRVFKACLLIVKRHAVTMVICFSIFLLISVVVTAFSTEGGNADFSETRPNVTLINRDGETPLLRGLRDYLLTHSEEVLLADEKEALQDATFYQATDYILIIPDGFSDAFFAGEPVPLQTVTTPNSANGYYADSLVNQYLNLAAFYRKAGFSAEEMAAHTLSDLSLGTTVEKKQFGETQPVDAGYEVYHRMLGYILLVLVILCVSTLLMAFQRPDVNMRNLCSPLLPRSVSLQMALCGCLISLVAWLLLNAVGVLLYRKSLAGCDPRAILLILFNSLLFMLISLSIAMLASTFIRGSNTQNAISNFLSLSLCFLGGVFVPVELLGAGLRTVAQFLPTYWYVTALHEICALHSFESEALTPVWQAFGIELAFAVAIFCVALVLGKYRRRSERYFGSIQTELEQA